MRNAVQGRFDIERCEQTSRVREKQGAAKKPFAFRDIAKAPDSTDNVSLDPLRDGVAFKYASVLESQNVETLPVRVSIQFPNAANEAILVFDLIDCGRQQLIVISTLCDLCWNLPQRKKALVIG